MPSQEGGTPLTSTTVCGVAVSTGLLLPACFSGRDYAIGWYDFAVARTTGGWLGFEHSWYVLLIQSTASPAVMCMCRL